MAGGHKQAVSPAVKFLCGLFSVEPRKVQLVAIQKGKGPVDTRLVHPETEAPLIDKFLDEHNSTRARRHCYFGINEVTTPGKKAKASEIGHVRAFHVDIDCGESEEAQKRALDRLMKDRPAGVPEPTAIVFSGGGFWAFWALKDPIAVNGDEALLENLTDVNRRLAEVFEAEGGDSCFDISRIARLPGSINYASDKGGGRTDRKATVLHDDWGTGQKPRRYALNDFLKLPAGEGRSAVGKRSGPGRGAGAASAGGGRSCPPPVPAVSWTDLGYQIGDDGEPTNPDDLSAVIASGPDARDLSERELRERWKKPSGEWDRSLAVYYVCCELDRRGVKPDVIAAVILDRTFGISDHLYDHVKGEGERPSFSRAMYARRQVERAMADNDAVMAEKIAAPEPPFLYAEALPWLNARYATIENFGGKYRVMARPGVDDPVEPKFQDKTQWAFRFDGQMVGVPDPESGDLKSVPLAKAWLGDRRRSRFNRVEFDPEGAPDPNVLNLWQGFHLPNKATDCEEYLALTRDVIAAGDPVVFDYLVKWMALRIQRPGLKLEVALALQGGQGLGKSLWVELFGDLFGAHFVAVSGKHGIASNFNAHLQRCLLLLGDEMNAGSDRQMVAG